MSITKITIDCWGTLLKSSPAFKAMKYNYVRNFDVRLKYLTDLEIENAFKKTKDALNTVIESTGSQPSQYTIYQSLLTNLKNRFEWNYKIDDFYYGYQTLALEYAPQLYSESTIQTLLELKTKGELWLSSNTMFISGKTLFDIFKKIGLNRCFKGYNFSDEVKMSKPHRKMYVVGGGYSKYHIGDNELTDGSAPQGLGIHSYIINSNTKTLRDAYNFIAQREIPF